MTQIKQIHNLSHNLGNPDLDLHFFCYLVAYLKKFENIYNVHQFTLQEVYQDVLSQFNFYCYQNDIFNNPVYSLPDHQEEFKIAFPFFERIIKNIVMVNYFSLFSEKSETQLKFSFDVKEHVLYFLELFIKGKNFVNKYILYHILFHIWLNNKFPKYCQHIETPEIYNDFIDFLDNKISSTLQTFGDNFTLEDKELLKQIKEKNVAIFSFEFFTFSYINRY